MLGVLSYLFVGLKRSDMRARFDHRWASIVVFFRGVCILTSISTCLSVGDSQAAEACSDTSIFVALRRALFGI